MPGGDRLQAFSFLDLLDPGREHADANTCRKTFVALPG